MTKKMVLIKDIDRSFTLNVLIAALHAMEKRSDADPRIVAKYRAKIAAHGTTVTVVR